MKFERTKNSSRVFMFGLIYNILITFLPFTTRSIIVYKLGMDYLGLSSLFTSVISMLNMSNLGIASAVTFCMYKVVAEDDKDSICALLKFLQKFYRIIGGIILGCGLVVMPFLPRFIKENYPDTINIYLLYLIYLLNTAASYFLFAFKNVLLEAYQRGDVIHKVQSIVELCKYGIQIIILLFFADYYWFAAMLPIASIVINIFNNMASNRLFPECQPRGELKETYKNIIKYKVIFLALHSVTSTFTNSIDNIVISACIGLTAIAQYGNYSYISTAVLSVILIAYKAVKSAVGNALVTESKTYNFKTYNSLHFLCSWICMWCTVCLICLLQPFMTMWMGRENLLSTTTVVMIGLFFYVNGMRQFLTIIYIGSAGMWDKTLLRQVIATVVNLILDIVLVESFGITGIVFASFFSYAVIALPMDIAVVYKFVLGEKVVYGFFKMLVDYIWLVILCVTTYTICAFLPNDTFIFFAIKLLICAAIPNLVIVIFFYNREEFQFIKQHIKLLLPSKKVNTRE